MHDLNVLFFQFKIKNKKNTNLLVQNYKGSSFFIYRKSNKKFFISLIFYLVNSKINQFKYLIGHA